MDDQKVPHLALVAGWGTFFVPFSGRLVGFHDFSGGVAYGFGDVLNGHCLSFR